MIQWLLQQLLTLGTLQAASQIYTTMPWGKSGPGITPYTNAVARLETTLTLPALIEATKRIERLAGRQPHAKEVAADIDIVIWNSRILRPQETERDYFKTGYQQITAHV